MLYPLLSEYIEAILSPEDSFDELKDLRPVLDEAGRPIMSSGNFAVVFKLEDNAGKQYAIKCFLREQEGRQRSYSLITRTLDCVDSPFFINVRYLHNELLVDTSTSEQAEFDVLVMDWVDGMTLDKYIKEHIGSNYCLSDLAYRFSILANWLFEQPFAHGDLKPDNIIVKKDGQLVLVDYDGMFVPGMEGQEAREIGSPDFRHPERSTRKFDARIDDFPLTSILLSLKLIAIKPELLEQYGAQDRLLFSANDYLNPDECPLLDENLVSGWEIDDIRGDFMWLLKHGESYHSIRVFKDPIMDFGFEDVSDEDLASAIEDTYGVKYSQDGLRLLQAPSSLTEYDVKDGTLCLCRKAFECCHKLKIVRLPESVARIGSLCFNECGELQEITIPPRVTVIERETFKRCFKLSNVYFCSIALKKIDVEAFICCEGLLNIELPDTVTEIGTRAFEGCTSLHTIRLPHCLISIGWDAFNRCSSLVSICLPKLKQIGQTAFGFCSSLENIYIPDSVEYIEEGAFHSCSSLSSVRLPGHLKHMGEGVFTGCISLKKIYGECISSGQPELIIGGEFILIVDKSIVNYVLPERVTKIPQSAFRGCIHLKSITLHDKLIEIGAWAFSNCVSLERIEIPESVKSIGSGSFYGCKSLLECNIPPQISTLSGWLFEGCSSLNRVVLPDTLTQIKNEVFARCEALKEICIPKSVWAMGYKAFFGCTSLSKIELPSRITKIAYQMFEDCIALVDIVIPNNVERIEGSVFKGCISLSNVNLPSSLLSLGIDEVDCRSNFSGVFEGCNSLKKIEIPDTVRGIGDHAFKDCSSLEEIILPNEYCLHNDVFKGCTSLKTIVVPVGCKNQFEECNFGEK